MGIKMVLSGEGADEIFGGYLYFHKAPILAVKAGWAEQDPQMWWENAKLSLKKIMCEANASADEIAAIGISYLYLYNPKTNRLK